MADTTFVNGTPVVPDWLNDVNDFVYHSNVGDATGVTYTLPSSGNTRHVSDVLSEHVSVTDFPGADPTGVSDSSAAFNAALASGKKRIFVPEGTYLVDGLVFPAGGGVTMYGVNKRSTKLQKNGNGDMISIPGGYCELRGLYLDGNKTSGGKVGRGVVYTGASTPNCVIENCQITDFDGYCVEFEAITSGSGFTMQNCRVFRNDFSKYAVKTSNDAGAGTPRKFIDCLSSGANFGDFSGADNIQVIGGVYGGTGTGNSPFKFDANSHKIIFAGVRLQNGGGSITFYGLDINIGGMVSAGSVYVGSGADNVILHGCISAGEITVNSGAIRYTVADCQANSGFVDWAMSRYGWFDIPAQSYSTTWSGSVSNPTLGNGTLAATYSRSRDTIRINIDLVIGATTTLGSGYWSFSLPFTKDASSTNHAIGTAHISCAGNYYVGAVVVSPGDNYLTVYVNGTGTQMGSASPGAWVAGNRVWLQIDIPVW